MFGDFGDRLDHPGLIIDVLDRDQRTTAGQRGIERSKVDHAVRADGKGDGPFPHRRRNRVMLGRADQASFRCRGAGGDRNRLARARCEDDVMTPAETFGDGPTRDFHRGARGAAFGMG